MAKIQRLEAAKHIHDSEYKTLMGVAITMDIPEFRLRCRIQKLEHKAEHYRWINDRQSGEIDDLVDQNTALKSEVQALKEENTLLGTINQDILSSQRWVNILSSLTHRYDAYYLL